MHYSDAILFEVGLRAPRHQILMSLSRLNRGRVAQQQCMYRLYSLDSCQRFDDYINWFFFHSPPYSADCFSGSYTHHANILSWLPSWGSWRVLLYGGFRPKVIIYGFRANLYFFFSYSWQRGGAKCNLMRPTENNRALFSGCSSADEKTA